MRIITDFLLKVIKYSNIHERRAQAGILASGWGPKSRLRSSHILAEGVMPRRPRPEGWQSRLFVFLKLSVLIYKMWALGCMLTMFSSFGIL